MDFVLPISDDVLPVPEEHPLVDEVRPVPEELPFVGYLVPAPEEPLILNEPIVLEQFSLLNEIPILNEIQFEQISILDKVPIFNHGSLILNELIVFDKPISEETVAEVIKEMVSKIDDDSSADSVVEAVAIKAAVALEKGVKKRGGFKRDGSTHYSGIQNEHTIVDTLNSESSIIGKSLLTSPDWMVSHKGGTKTKADAVIINKTTGNVVKTISIKNHKTGTFDWLNSTSGLPDILREVFKRDVSLIKENYKVNPDVDNARMAADKMFNDALIQIGGDDAFIRGLLQSIYQKYTDIIIIHSEKEKKYVSFEKDELLELMCYPDETYYLKHKQGCCSAQIMRRSQTGVETNTHLRVRLVLNNGINALVGQSSKNKSSVPCIKIQQDNVEHFMGCLKRPIVESLVEHLVKPLKEEPSVNSFEEYLVNSFEEILVNSFQEGEKVDSL